MPSTGAEMVATWNRVLHQLGYRDPAQIGLPLAPAGPSTPSIASLDRDAAAEVVVSRLGAARSAWNAADIRGGVEQWIAATGLVAEAAVRVELAEDITDRALTLSVPLLDTPGVPEHVRALTSPRVLGVEADLVAAMADRATGPSSPAPPVEVQVEAEGLDEAQRNAVAVLAGSPRLVVVEGAAGAGKTTILAATQRQLEQQGHRLVVVTPTLKAAQVAARTATQARSAAALVHEYGWRWDDDGHWTHDPNTPPRTVLRAGDLLLVDETGMLDQDTARALFVIADQTGARVALVGDRHQLPAVGRGGVLDLAARRAGPEAVVGLDVVHRFTDPEYAAISLAMRHGGPIGEAPGERTGEGSGEQSGERSGTRGEVFDALWARGQIRLHATETERLHATAAEAAAQLAAGEVGETRVVVMADSRATVTALNGIIRDHLAAAGHVDNTHTMVTAAGERIGVGDRVATRLNDRDLGVANRDLWTVTAIHDGTLTLTRATRHAGGHGEPVEVPASYARTQVELAYATTVYGAQGETTSTGHMLIAEATSGSAAYVGMTRGRDQNVAHLVAEDVEQARAIWGGVMGRDRADLGPAHAKLKAAEEMERYAPQRPVGVVLDRLRGAWTAQADVTTRWERLDQQRQQIEAVLAVRGEYAPRHEQLRHTLHEAMERWEQATGALRDLEAAMTIETQGTVGELWRHWQADQPMVHDALATIRDGAGPLGLRRRQVRDAHNILAAWAEKWRPLLPELATGPSQITQQIRQQADGTSRDQLRQAIAQVAEHATARAHPEAEHLRSRARITGQAAEAADQALQDLQNDLADKLQPYSRVAYRPDLPGVLDQTRADLDALTPQVQAAARRVHALTNAPEIRALPVGRLAAERDQWNADRQAAHEAARAAALQKAALDHEAQARRRLHSTQTPPAHGGDRGGPGIGR